MLELCSLLGVGENFLSEETNVKMEPVVVEQKVYVDSVFEADNESNDQKMEPSDYDDIAGFGDDTYGPSSDEGSDEEYMPKLQKKAKAEIGEEDSEKAMTNKVKERERKRKWRQSKANKGSDNSDEDYKVPIAKLKKETVKERRKKEKGEVKKNPQPQVWTKDPSPERLRNGVKTEFFYMAEGYPEAGPPYKCLLCDHSSTAKRNLKVHFCNIHSKERLYKCIVCNAGKVHSSQVVEHWNRVHNPNKDEFLKLSCDICGKRYSIPSELKNHQMLHDDQDYPCKYCGKLFPSPVRQKAHEQSHEQEPVPCNICGKVLRSERDAQIHERTVHNNEFKVDCEVCGKTLKTKDNLRLHLAAIHGTLPKNHHCDMCGMSFKVASILKKHIAAVHTKEAQFPCPYCETVLSSRNQFKRHSNRRHGGMDLPQELKDQIKLERENVLVKVNKPFSIT